LSDRYSQTHKQETSDDDRMVNLSGSKSDRLFLHLP